MDTGKLKRFATEARNILMGGVKSRLQTLGFNEEGTPIEMPQPMEGGAVFMGEVWSLDFYQKWMSLYRAVRLHGVREVTEEAAYTWFNRLVAIRIMTKQGFTPPVLAYEAADSPIPVIVAEARQGRTPQMDEETLRQWTVLKNNDSLTDEQFALLIRAYCHDNPLIYKCFGTITDYTELLLPSNILATGGFVDLLNHTDYISEEDYSSPELIGWLYQFYIADRKDEVFAKKGKFEADEIPAATQIFTPNWIVKYMVQNSVGRIYLDNYTDATDLRSQWTYLVEGEPTPAEQVYHLDDLANLRVGDFACGSGHILNECFDILYALYIYEGYSRTQAIEHIFRHNLTGIDLDVRAKQLATFALLMKACQQDKSFLDAHLMPRVLEMPHPFAEKCEAEFHSVEDKRAFARPLLTRFIMGENQEIINELTDALLLMDDALTLGSIMKFDISEQTRNVAAVRLAEYEQERVLPEDIRALLPYMRIILALTDKYAAVVMNPPYMGSGNMNETLSRYVQKNYKEGKADLFSVFMMLALDRIEPNGKYGMINMQSWMFLSSFEKLRKNLLEMTQIDSMLHLGPRTFDELSGEVVQNTAFVITNHKPMNGGTYCRLIEGKSCGEKERMFLAGENRYANVSQQSFEKIPGCPIGYWVSEKAINVIQNGSTIYEVATPRQGLATGDNNRFLRLIWEIDTNKRGKIKWVPCTKGGSFRKWYGNIEYCVNWEKDGYEIKNFVDDNDKLRSRPQNIQCYFKADGCTWSTISSGKPSFRLFKSDWLFETKGSVCFPKDVTNNNILLGYLNSPIVSYYLKVFSPTMDYHEGPVGRLPYIKIDSKRNIYDIVSQNISLSRQDWNAHEISWNFKINELVTLNGNKYEYIQHEYCQFHKLCVDWTPAKPESLEWRMDVYQTKWETKFLQLHQNEEELNRQFIEIYGLQDELTPDVPLDEVTILQQGEINIENNQLKWHPDVILKQLISYAIGCMMGRYSLDKPGLILANQGDTIKTYHSIVPESRFEPDDDGIIPLMSINPELNDNATFRFKKWLEVAFGEEAVMANLNFVERSIGKSINDYFLKDFWKDHKRMYQNRPIYWLFSSRKGAFQCLAYMHRMDAYTAGHVRTKYLLPHIEWLVARQNEMQERAAELKPHERKELDSIGKQIDECREYHDRLHSVADQQIDFDLDDGVVVNYAKFGDVLAKLK
ncbi:MAG: BREX-1 system adenine-specific DNA-methyltransferase PglX [Mediterranea sp.]|jgi:hypothetical protein|nr:BREX-1 system adenine-specific DNA-methyltransferase PglX [Mediterranea sp.]